MERDRDKMCFACGSENPIGLKLDFELEEGVIWTSFTPEEVHQGFDGIVHGGLISTLLDEVMANVLYLQGIRAVTAKMEVKFRQPANVGEELLVEGWIERKKRKTITTKAKVVNPGEEKIAEAEGVFVKKENKD